MATPNYSYEKRQRELAKKRKAEDKRQRKAASLPSHPDEGGAQDPAATSDDGSHGAQIAAPLGSAAPADSLR